MNPTYQDVLAYYGVGGAHPGGLALTKKLLSAEKLTKHTKILDAGCGTGQTSAYIAKTYQSRVTAIDQHQVMIEKAQKRFANENLYIEIVKGKVEKLPFPNKSFDLILSESVTVFTNIEKTLKEYYRVLKPNGILLDMDMTAERQLDRNEKNRIKEVYSINRVPSENQWKETIKKSGFKSVSVISSSSVFSKLILPSIEEQPEYDESPSIDSKIHDIWKEHLKLTLLYSLKLGHRVYRAIR